MTPLTVRTRTSELDYAGEVVSKAFTCSSPNYLHIPIVIAIARVTTSSVTTATFT